VQSTNESAVRVTDPIRPGARELERLYQTLSSEAVLGSHEPNVKVRVARSDGAGHLHVRVDITPDHLAQGHWFEFEIDQSYFEEVQLVSCNRNM
jgi:hypothetical protein